MTHRFPVASKFPWVDFGGGGFRGVATLPNGQNHSVKCIYIGKRLVVARVYNKEGGRVSYSLYPCVTAVVTVHDLLPYHLIQAVTFHTYTTIEARGGGCMLEQ